MALAYILFAGGQDESVVKTSRQRKSLSVERTFSEDLPSLDSCLTQLPELLRQLEGRLSAVGEGCQVVKGFVKVKFEDFTTTTLERMGTQAKLEDYASMVEEAYGREERPVRLIGLGVRFVVDTEPKKDTVQLGLAFD